MILVSIIIVNYNTRDLLKACLESIYEKTKDITFEIIVVDNASVDSSVEMVKSKFPLVNLIVNNSNIGFGNANNIGVINAKGKCIWFLNSDTLLINNAVRILYDAIMDYPKSGIAGGNLFDRKLNPTTSFYPLMPGILSDIDYLFFNIFSKIKYKQNLNFNYTNRILEIDGFITGADLMIKKTVFEELGGFDSDFFMYYEETELTYRLKKTGLKVISVPDAKIVHLEGASEIKKENTLRRTFESKNTYINKTNLYKIKIILRFIFILTTYQRFLLNKLFGNKDKANSWSLARKVDREIYKKYSK
jgi:GT2 family glycosyltransferase